MKSTNFFKIIFIYFFIFIFFTLVYLLSFHLPIFNQQTVLFYRGITLLTLISIFFFIFTLVFHYFRPTKYLQSIISAIVISISLNICFFVVFPVTFDRSVTMYLLNTLENQTANKTQKYLSENDLETLFINEYVKSQKAIGRRIQEQSMIDFLEKKSDQIYLTPKSLKFLNLSKTIKKIYNLE